MHGLGPYVIKEITLGGAICLETLEEEPLPNSINGSCFKIFHEPLTLDMLECIHATKSKKLALQQLKKKGEIFQGTSIATSIGLKQEQIRETIII